MAKNKATALPAKRFFVEMLIRDIELQDAILDLLDNCVDGAMRRNLGKAQSKKKPYAGFSAWIQFDEHSFTISDDCGGIPRDVAEDSAFRMGRKDSARDKDLPTVGVYGIGMKRAIFKMGKAATVLSQTPDGKGFEVAIDSAWMDNDEDWNLPIKDVVAALDRAGTVVKIEELRPNVARLLSNDTDFLNDLEKSISAYYGYIMEKGFTVYLNGKTVEPQQISLLLDKGAFANSEGMAPYVYTTTQDGVSVELAVGIYRDLPSDADEDAALAGRPSTERAGWTIICNDRVVMHADKTRVTGWGEATVPMYHTQFVSIAGVVIFRSNDPGSLPITTTKRGVDGNSELYLGVKEYMREGLKLFTDYTNSWKSAAAERAKLNVKVTSVHAENIAALVPSAMWGSIRKGIGGTRYRPNLPLPKESDPVKQIRFSRKMSDIRKVSRYIFDDEGIAPAEVGAQCFDDILAKVDE